MIRTRARPWPQSAGSMTIGVTLTPVGPRAAPIGESVGSDCVPAITGLQYCYTLAAPHVWVSDEAEVPTYTIQPNDEEPACAAEDLTFSLDGGYVPTEQAGYYVFGLAGESCGCVPQWTVTFAEADDPVWTDLPEVQHVGQQLVIRINGSATLRVGVMSITGRCNGVDYGPILLTFEAGY